MKASTPTFDADLTDDQARALDTAYRAIDPIRRAALTVLARSSHQLAITSDADGEAMLGLAEEVEHLRERHQAMGAMIDAAHARIWLMLGIAADEFRADVESPVEPDRDDALARLQALADMWSDGVIGNALFDRIDLALARTGTGCPELIRDMVTQADESYAAMDEATRRAGGRCRGR